MLCQNNFKLPLGFITLTMQCFVSYCLFSIHGETMRLRDKRSEKNFFMLPNKNLMQIGQGVLSFVGQTNKLVIDNQKLQLYIYRLILIFCVLLTLFLQEGVYIIYIKYKNVISVCSSVCMSDTNSWPICLKFNLELIITTCMFSELGLKVLNLASSFLLLQKKLSHS